MDRVVRYRFSVKVTSSQSHRRAFGEEVRTFWAEQGKEHMFDLNALGNHCSVQLEPCLYKMGSPIPGHGGTESWIRGWVDMIRRLS